MSQFPIRAPNPAGCEWERWHRKETRASAAWNRAWCGEAVQVAYGNKDYAAGLCVFGRGLSSLGQSMKDSVPTESKTTEREMLNKLSGAIHIIESKHSAHTRMFV